MGITPGQVDQLRRGSTQSHLAGLHRLGRLLAGLGDVAKAVREGEDEAALGMLDDLIERGVKVASDVERSDVAAAAEAKA